MTRQHFLMTDSAAHAAQVNVQTLTPADIPHLNLGNHPKLGDGDAEALVIQSPGLSKWIAETGEFVLVVPWRHRAEIPSVDTLWAFRHESELMSAVIASAEASGHAGFVVLDAYETRRPSFYANNRLELLETIVTYEHSQPMGYLDTIHSYRQQFYRIDHRRPELAKALPALDHAAFPWLWWNAEAEFSSYMQLPNVELWAGVIDDDVVSYIGVTHFRGWGHLDRIAIRPDVQGQGLGRETLHFAVKRMVARGARRVGLSTQGENERSRRLYETVGFRETPQHNYGVYGVMFASGRELVAQGG
jgi:ribosomal protein S18 acetylase RimI-like enzyme